MKLYVLIVDSVIDYSTEREVKVFANQKDAEEAFKDEVILAIADAGEDWETEESIMTFSIYEDGYYVMNHINVVVLEKELIK